MRIRTTLAAGLLAATGVLAQESLSKLEIEAKRAFDSGLFAEAGNKYSQAAQAEGRGILMLVGHFTCLEMASRFLTRKLSFDAVYRPQNNLVFERFSAKYRNVFAASAIPRDDVRGMLRRLRAGRVLMYLPDQDYGRRHAVFVPFFGIPAATITSTARLADSGNAVALPVFYYSRPGGRYEVVFGEPLAVTSKTTGAPPGTTGINTPVGVTIDEFDFALKPFGMTHDHAGAGIDSSSFTLVFSGCAYASKSKPLHARTERTGPPSSKQPSKSSSSVGTYCTHAWMRTSSPGNTTPCDRS